MAKWASKAMSTMWREWWAWHCEFREAGLEHVRGMVKISAYHSTQGKFRFARSLVWLHDNALPLLAIAVAFAGGVMLKLWIR
jgi:hypothetical protein